jgi:hypothetical protein
MRRLALCLFMAAMCLSLAVVDASEMEVESEEQWNTLLEHTAIAGNKFAPEGRTLEEKTQLTQTPQVPQALGSEDTARIFHHGEDSRGHAGDTDGNIRENQGRAREPVSEHFGTPDGFKAGSPALPKAARAPRKVCKKKNKKPHQTDGPETPAPDVVPPPVGPPRPLPQPPKSPPKHNPWPRPPAPEHPLPTPPKPTCGELCNPGDADPVLARVPPAPLGDAAIATIGLEGSVVAKVQAKIRNREGWLRSQKNWLLKATEASATIKREIEMAEFTKDAIASDLEQLKKAQDMLSIRYKANQLKWSYKDNKIAMEHVKEEFQALDEIKADIKEQMEDDNREIQVLESTLGPPSQQIVINPKDLDDPLRVLEGIEPEENFGQHGL